MQKSFSQQLGLGVASLTFGVALSIFIYAASAGFVSGLQTALLYTTSFLLMLRFWWRYTELFVQHMPSKSFWQFLLDFLVSLFGISAVLFISELRTWALIGAAAMLSSAARCWLSWPGGKEHNRLKRTATGAIGMLVVFAGAYTLAPSVGGPILALAVFLIVLGFTVHASLKP